MGDMELASEYDAEEDILYLVRLDPETFELIGLTILDWGSGQDREHTTIRVLVPRLEERTLEVVC